MASDRRDLSAALRPRRTVKVTNGISGLRGLGSTNLASSGLLSRGFEDQPRDFVGLGDQRKMAGLHLDGLGAHALGDEAFEIGIDRPVFRRNRIETRLRPPGCMRCLARKQSLVERL